MHESHAVSAGGEKLKINEPWVDDPETDEFVAESPSVDESEAEKAEVDERTVEKSEIDEPEVDTLEVNEQIETNDEIGEPELRATEIFKPGTTEHAGADDSEPSEPGHAEPESIDREADDTKTSI